MKKLLLAFGLAVALNSGVAFAGCTGCDDHKEGEKCECECAEGHKQDKKSVKKAKKAEKVAAPATEGNAGH